MIALPASIRASSSILAAPESARDVRAHRFGVALLGHPEVRIGERRDLRQVGHAEHLPARAQRLQQRADGRRDRAADAGVDLVEDRASAPAPTSLVTTWIASAIRDSSPPEATLASGPSGCFGWLATRNSTCSTP